MHIFRFWCVDTLGKPVGRSSYTVHLLSSLRMGMEKISNTLISFLISVKILIYKCNAFDFGGPFC